MDAYLAHIIQLVDTMKETENTLSVTAPGFGSTASTNTGFVRVSLIDPSERTMTQDELAKRTSALAQQFNFARTFAVQEATIGGGRFAGLPVQYVIQAPDFEGLRKVIPAFMEAAQEDPTFSVVDLNLKFNKPQLDVEIDRDRAKALGVSVHDIAQTLQLYFSGQRFGFFIFKGKQYEVIGQAARDNRDASRWTSPARTCAMTRAGRCNWTTWCGWRCAAIRRSCSGTTVT
jgi:multidrug efflux pump subunit AcrB